MGGGAVAAGPAEARLRGLGPGDLGALLALYARVAAEAPHGHLAARPADEFAALLADPAALAIGAEAGGVLVGYVLCRSGPVAALGLAPLGRLAIGQDEAVAASAGILVARDWRRRRVAAALIRMRSARLSDRGVRHHVGLVATDNHRGIHLHLGSGALLVGLHRDSQCWNFVHYTGALIRRRPDGPPASLCDLGDRASLDAGFARGLAGLSLDRAAAPRLALAPWDGFRR